MAPHRLPKSGHPQIDQAHDNLAARLGEIGRLWREQAAPEVLHHKTKDIREAMAQHFEEERDIFSSFGISSPDHAEMHAAMLFRVDTLMSMARHVARSRDWYNLVEQLEAILYEHEVVEDGRFFPLLAG